MLRCTVKKRFTTVAEYVGRAGKHGIVHIAVNDVACRRKAERVIARVIVAGLIGILACKAHAEIKGERVILVCSGKAGTKHLAAASYVILYFFTGLAGDFYFVRQNEQLIF